MTKQEFLSGKEFALCERTHSKYKYDNGMIVELNYYKNKLQFSSHEANVENVRNKYFTFYNFCLSKRISGKINFQNL